MFIVCFLQDLSGVPLSGFAIICPASSQEVSIYYGVWTPDIWQVFALLFSTIIFHTICLPSHPLPRFTVRKQSLGQSLAEDLVVGRPDGTKKK